MKIAEMPVKSDFFGAPKRARTPKPSSEDSCDIHFTMGARATIVKYILYNSYGSIKTHLIQTSQVGMFFLQTYGIYGYVFFAWQNVCVIRFAILNFNIHTLTKNTKKVKQIYCKKFILKFCFFCDKILSQ